MIIKFFFFTSVTLGNIYIYIGYPFMFRIGLNRAIFSLRLLFSA